MEQTPLRASGISKILSLAQINLTTENEEAGFALVVFEALRQRGINIHFVADVVGSSGRSHMIVCVEEPRLEEALEAILAVQKRIGLQSLSHRRHVAVLSIFGPHFRDKPGSAHTAMTAFAAAGVNVLGICTSFSAITVIVEQTSQEKAVEALRTTFEVPVSAVFRLDDGLSRRD